MVDIIFSCSAGGHLSEILNLKKLFETHSYVILTEKTPIAKSLSTTMNMKFLFWGGRNYPIRFLFKFIGNIIRSFFYILYYNPKIVVSSGSHSSVPICYWAKLFRKKLVYIESFAKINDSSISGRLVYPIADVFIVQWASMLQVYPRAKYLGGIY